MFDTVADQADGLRRLFSPREPSLIPIGCCAPAASCRHYGAALIERLGRSGFTPLMFDRLGLTSELGEVQAHAPVDRLLLLDEPLRLARWLKNRQQSMVLLLSGRRDALPDQYATVKAIVNGTGLRRFATVVVDAPTAAAGTAAHHQLASCARRFLDVEIEPLVRGAHGMLAVDEILLARLERFQLGIPGSPPSDLLLPGSGISVPH